MDEAPRFFPLRQDINKQTAVKDLHNSDLSFLSESVKLESDDHSQHNNGSGAATKGL